MRHVLFASNHQQAGTSVFNKSPNGLKLHLCKVAAGHIPQNDDIVIKQLFLCGGEGFNGDVAFSPALYIIAR